MNTQEIQKAIDEDRICLFIQPILSVDTQKFHSAELLARIIDEHGNIIPPSEFIPEAEESEVMFSLEIKILQKICDILIRKDIQDLHLEYVEINLSAKNAEQNLFLVQAKEIIDNNDIIHKKLNVEITESAKPQDQTVFFKNLNILRDNDFRISLDDFGTGLSNFQYLLNIPAKLVKLDMSLIQSAFSNEKSISVIHGIILTTHAIGSRVVGEGVEDEKTFELLRDLNVDYIQGYYFSKPLPVDEFIDFMKQHS